MTVDSDLFTPCPVIAYLHDTNKTPHQKYVNRATANDIAVSAYTRYLKVISECINPKVVYLSIDQSYYGLRLQRSLKCF